MAADTDSQEKKALAIKALERRNAAEKLQQQKIISKPKPPHVGGKSSTKEDSSSATPSKQVPVSFWTPNSAHPQDAGDNCESYFELSHPVHENLLKPDAKSNGEASSMVSKILHDLFQRGDYGHKYLQGWKRMKIDNCILLDNHVRRSKNPDYHIKALKTFSKRSKKHMSRKQHKKCGSFEMPQDIRNMNQSDVAQCLLNADLHGAIILGGNLFL
ncbi:hypothetical protein Tsubulata_016303 [Turnera subulata]|uniref:Uncharacterized protein n=1 Tax=Turnera subulata TaxID=218843 RepID=A0A9Q0JK55_9ROSI|nr:hypothetical protein Tsubulata_016303 [Turnera subulata]